MTVAYDAYGSFLDSKRRDFRGLGLSITPDALPAALKDFQARLTAWGLHKGRAAIWADTGLGKTWMQTAWAAQIPGRVLILAPLCVAEQTIAEAAHMDIEVAPLGSGTAIEITNYEQLHHVYPSAYTGVVLDESSILKSFDGKTRTRLVEAFGETPYRLCCTATPAPNDIAELANHCEFLGIMSRAEMLATYFVHDDEGWRLKRHAPEAFYRWLASWGMFVRRPSDLGFSDDGYLLPELTIHDVIVGEPAPEGESLGGVRGRLKARRDSIKERVEAAVQLVSDTPGQWIVWCGLNDEQGAVAQALGEQAVSVAGADNTKTKRARIEAFIGGAVRVIVSKPSIMGFGLNLQQCNQMVFVGLGDSYESYYQSIRRCYRFGQTQPVNAHVVVSAREVEVVANVRRKEAEAAVLAEELVKHMAASEKEEIGMTVREREVVERAVAHGKGWTLFRGDCVNVMHGLPDDTIDLSVYSPPFASLYTYTNSEHDLGNCSDMAEFLKHYGFVARELLRVTKPGRLTCVHVAQVAAMLSRDGFIGMRDIRGAVIQCYIENGWMHHGEVCIDKNPQAQAIRTHSKALLFKQLRTDASWLRPAIADNILLFRKPGDNAVPVLPDITNDDWIKWAHPIWYDVRENDTLNVRAARGDKDERHICPLQLPVIARCIRLWSNRGEMVLSPFAGLGSEGYEALRHGRKYIGIELKREYFETAVANLRAAEQLPVTDTPMQPPSGPKERTPEQSPDTTDTTNGNVPSTNQHHKEAT